MVTVDPYRDSPSDARRPVPIGVATLLRQARARRGLSLEQVAFETKVPVHRLEALERHGLPDSNRGFYQRARICAYARAVDLDERLVLAELDRETGAPAAAQQPPPARRRSSRGQHVATLVACAVIVAGISHMVWNAQARGTANHATPIVAASQPEPRAVPMTENTPAGVQSTPPVAEFRPLVVEDVGKPEPVAPAQSATTVTLTELVITTDPAAARVAVNGIGWGSTPITIQHLPPGEQRIRVTKDGYSAVERIAHVSEDRSTAVNIPLQPAP